MNNSVQSWKSEGCVALKLSNMILAETKRKHVKVLVLSAKYWKPTINNASNHINNNNKKKKIHTRLC